MVRLVFRTTALVVALCLLSGAAHAQDWAKKMFEVTTHDFGTTARGARSEFLFEITNTYKEDVHIASVRTSCKCTTPTIFQGKDTLKTWEKGGVLAAFNTASFLGPRSATITVVIDKPFFAEVQLHVNGTIRGDIEFQPGAVEFSSVDQGSPKEISVTVTHHSKPDWKITDVRSINENLEVEMGDAVRKNGNVSYPLIVRLKGDAPAGMLQDQLNLVTNDPSGNVGLMVQGNVVPPLTVSPATLFLGVLKPGQTVTKQLVVRSKKPFRIQEVECTNGEALQVNIKDEAKTLHLIPVTFTAGSSPTDVDELLKIHTDLAVGGTVTCPCKATVKPVDTVAGAAKGNTVLKPAD